MKLIKLIVAYFTKTNDPVKHCKIYKTSGCTHVDGYLCDMKSCSTLIEYELFELEQQLDIPTNLRYYKTKYENTNR